MQFQTGLLLPIIRTQMQMRCIHNTALLSLFPLRLRHPLPCEPALSCSILIASRGIPGSLEPFPRQRHSSTVIRHGLGQGPAAAETAVVGRPEGASTKAHRNLDRKTAAAGETSPFKMRLIMPRSLHHGHDHHHRPLPHSDRSDSNKCHGKGSSVSMIKSDYPLPSPNTQTC